MDFYEWKLNIKLHMNLQKNNWAHLLKCWYVINSSYSFAHVTIPPLNKYQRVRTHASAIACHSLRGMGFINFLIKNLLLRMQISLSNKELAEELHQHCK